MSTTSPRKLAIIVALISSFITLLAGMIVLIIKDPNYILSLIFVVLVVFFSVFIITYYSINNFIFQKIKPLYKAIQSVNITEKELKQSLEDKDIIENVQTDVMVWARKKTKEITQLRQLEKYRREFLGNVSHELKTPIFNIQGYILTLLDGGLEDNSINHLYLERTEKSVNRLISIVNDLESISRLESGELKLEKKRFDIIKAVEDSLEENEVLANEQNIKLQFLNNPDKPIFVIGDKKRIIEVINNLIVNSIKYGKKGGKTTVDFMDMGDQIMVEIADDGIGISEKDLPRIFERFFRTDKSRSRDMGGTGLGLSIVKHIIEAHNQTINVRSKLNVGTSFNFTLEKS
jgi:two-component system, OmpR family, phosphate regulon sensor histidine kinase PhoR